MADHLLAEIASGAESAEEAERHHQRALTTARDIGMRPLVAHCHRGLGILLARSGRRDQSREHLATAGAMFLEMGMPPGQSVDSDQGTRS